MRGAGGIDQGQVGHRLAVSLPFEAVAGHPRIGGGMIGQDQDVGGFAAEFGGEGDGVIHRGKGGVAGPTVQELIQFGPGMDRWPGHARLGAGEHQPGRERRLLPEESFEELMGAIARRGLVVHRAHRERIVENHDQGAAGVGLFPLRTGGGDGQEEEGEQLEKEKQRELQPLDFDPAFAGLDPELPEEQAGNRATPEPMSEEVDGGEDRQGSQRHERERVGKEGEHAFPVQAGSTNCRAWSRSRD